MVNKWINNSLFKLLSPPCVLCGDNYHSPQGSGIHLCRPCLQELPLCSTHQVCLLCSLPMQGNISDKQQICGRCQKKPPAWSSCISTFRYEDPVSYIIQALKFNGMLTYASLLGGMMANVIEAALSKSSSEKPDMIIPVPLHRFRLRQRGYNQSLELARPISAKLNIPINYSVCVRTRATEVQSLLSAQQRIKNVMGAFEFYLPENVRQIAIVDDVMTTSSTIDALSRIMLHNGVEKVHVWVCARAAAKGV